NADELWAMIPLSFENVMTDELVLELWNTCTPNEQKFLALRLETGLSLTEIAKILAVSRKTVYKYKWSILHKLMIL
ncbi:helix-turn-helix domain-containing protein, partial [Ligilactobacillus animalis]|uniref:helix-turn-helix domain-containing protein n=1 Tax=Ligilactobacillus animalis TaxID=1605 RepID=UPI002FD9DD2B